ncbi:hypothetical protein ISS05_01560 [Candidatus Woesearchaeota archaeon]|nr:hypothetical protein [Candidatus Woesearchaeota archaeon]
MKKIILFLFLVIFIIGCDEEQTEPEDIIGEQIGNNPNIIITKETYQGKDFEKLDIKYEKDNQEFQNYFDPAFRNALDWIKEDIEDFVFLGWWDYGHMIRGYTNNDVIIYSPSEDILWSLASGKWDEEDSGKFSTKEQIEDVVLALTTTDSVKTEEIMEKYNAEYVFVTKRDAASSFIFFKIAGLEDYTENYQPNEKAQETILFRMLNKEEVEGFSLAYNDGMVRIYKLI